MATTRLTTKFVEAVRPSGGRQVAYPDGQVAGLELRVSPGGRKVWSFRYRTQEGRQRRMSLGVFPSVDLGDARIKAMRVLGAVADGGDPASEARRAKEAARSQIVRTFGDLADAYLIACESGKWRPKKKTKRASTLATETAVLRRHIRPTLGKLELGDLTRRKVRNLLHGMTDAGIGAGANKAHAIIRQVCAYGIAEELLDTNPAMGLTPPADTKPKSLSQSKKPAPKYPAAAAKQAQTPAQARLEALALQRDPTPAEAESMAKAVVSKARRAARVRVRSELEGNTLLTLPVHRDHEGWLDQISEAFGSRSDEFGLVVLNQITAVIGEKVERRIRTADPAMNFALAAMEAIEPRNEMEAMTGTQIVARHSLVMAMMARENVADTIPKMGRS